jgi:protein ImuB
MSLCPNAVMVTADRMRDARAFEDLAVVVHSLVPSVELLRPGLMLCPAIGASRYYGSEEAFTEQLLTEVAAQTGTEAWAGVADGLLAAILAARDGRVVPLGESKEYLAPRPLRDLGVALRGTANGENLDVLMDLLFRLGIRTLGDLADLPAHNVTERFGPVGIWAQRLARAEDAQTVPGHQLPKQFVSVWEADPPMTTVEQAIMAARRLAEDLHVKLVTNGQGYDRLRVSAITETGEQLERTWRLEGVDAAGVQDRVRWQLDGWLTGRSGLLPSGALVRLSLEAEEVHPAGAGSARLWGTSGYAAARAVRGAERIHTMLGGGGVYQPVVQGGREPRGRIRLVEWGEDTIPLRPVDRPWPGAVPEPAPSLMPPEPVPVELTDLAGQPVKVGASLELSAGPVNLNKAPVKGWAGPWPVVERWWGTTPKRMVYLQVQVERSGKEETTLLACESGQWRLEGVYD